MPPSKWVERWRTGVIISSVYVCVLSYQHNNANVRQVEIFEARRFVGGKVGSWVDKDGNHIEMGLHVFFGCVSLEL